MSCLNQNYLPILTPENPVNSELILNKHKVVSDTFNCLICLNLVWKPESCSQCTRIYCSLCIKDVISKKCPNCKKSYEGNKLTISEKKVLGEIEIYCLYSLKSNTLNNLSGCCDQIITYDNYEKHFENCQFKPYKCIFGLCMFNGTLNQIKDHHEICEFNYVNCQYCNQTLCKRLLKSHENLCDHKLIICKLCNETIKEKDFHKEYSVCISFFQKKVASLDKKLIESQDEVKNFQLYKKIKDRELLYKDDQIKKLELQISNQNEASNENNGKSIFSQLFGS